MSHSRIAQELSLFSNCSYLGRFGTESWSNNFAGRSIEFINNGIDIPAVDWYRNIWSTRNGPVLLEAMEGFGHHVLWHSGLLLRLIRKYHGIAESNATSHNIKMVSAQLKHDIFKTLPITNGIFFSDNECEWKVFEFAVLVRSRACCPILKHSLWWQ